MNVSAMSARLRRVSRSLFCPEKLHSVLGMPSVLGALAFFQRFLIVAFVPLPGGRQHHWEGKRAANSPPSSLPNAPPRPPPSAATLTPLPPLLLSQKGESVKKMREEVSLRAGGGGGGAEGSAAPPALKGIFWRRGTGSRWSRRAQGMLGDVVRAGAGSQHG